MTPLYSDSPGLFDFESFRGQQSTFALLNLMLIAALLIIHTTFTDYVGVPSSYAVALLARRIRLAGGGADLVARRVRGCPPRERRPLLLWFPIALNSILTLILCIISAGNDHQFFILMVVPVLEAAFRLNLAMVVAIIVFADFLNFFSAYFLESVNEYFEAGATSIIYTLAGVLVWLLVKNLRRGEVLLKRNLDELNQTRERLMAEEKLAAVGRLSSAIAHEIRNPVAMISSSLATAVRPGQDEAEKRKLFEIAATEATRLERLTTDFLAYARPRPVRISRSNLTDTLNYIGSIAAAHAANKGVSIKVDANPDLEGDIDAGQLQQALLNLVLNAIDACQSGGSVTLRAIPNGQGASRLEVSNSAGPIPPEVTAHLFEPFFTTKPGGTGLGLAIARNVARAHRGDLLLCVNQPGQVCFSIEIPAQKASRAEVEP